MAGFKSRSVLRQVMAGERNIAADSIDKFVKGLGLNNEEAKFFRNLVLLNQSKSPERRQYYAGEIFKLKSYRKANPLRESQFNYFNHWYFVVIRELAYLPNFKNDPEWIANQINPPISVGEAKYAVEELLKLGFLIRKGGNLVPSEGWLTTTDEVTSSAIAAYHRSLIKLGAESMERFPRDVRDISGQTFAVSLKTAKTLKEMIQVFRKEIERVVSKETPDSSPDAVYQLNFQLFPVAGELDE